MNGKTLLTVSILFFFVFSVLSFSVDARKGVGIIWSTEKEMVNENSPICIEYGVYNPWDEDVNVTLTVAGELREVVTQEHSDVKFVPAGTTHDKAIPLKLCFTVPKVYEDDCIINGFLCEQTCEQQEVTFTGDVVAMEVKEQGPNSGMGSSTTLGVSVPLTLRVRCNPYPRDWTPVYLGVAIAAAAGIAVIYRRRK